jgi:hypothetical protein
MQVCRTQPITVKETLTVQINENMPLHCMHIRWHGDQVIAVGDFYQRPERALDLRLLSCGGRDELENRCRFGTHPDDDGSIGAFIHHPCHHPPLTPEVGWLSPHPLNDEETDSEIPLRTGCDPAALGIINQMADRARIDPYVPDSLFEQRAKCGKSRIGG